MLKQAKKTSGASMAELSLPDLLLMGFDKRLVNLRKERGLTQQALAEKAEMHVVQIRRYETNASQPSIEAIKKLATALAVRGHQTFFAGREADRQGRAGESDPQARRAALHPDVGPLPRGHPGAYGAARQGVPPRCHDDQGQSDGA